MKPSIICISALLVPSLVWGDNVTGTIDWTQRAALSTEVSGTVARVYVTPGQRVGKGVKLVSLDSRRFQARLNETQANEKRLKLALEEAQREYDRAGELYDRTVISERDLQLAEIAMAQADAEWAAAKAQLTQAQLDLEYATLRSPFAGVVIDVLTYPSATISPEAQPQTLVVLGDNRQWMARALVNQTQLMSLSNDSDISLQWQGERLSGKLLRIGSEANDDGLWRIDIAVPSNDWSLRAGQRIEISWP